MITVNGDPTDWFLDITVQDVIKLKNYLFPMIIVTVNGTYISPDSYQTTTIPDGALVQITHLISGG